MFFKCLQFNPLTHIIKDTQTNSGYPNEIAIYGCISSGLFVIAGVNESTLSLMP